MAIVHPGLPSTKPPAIDSFAPLGDAVPESLPLADGKVGYGARSPVPAAEAERSLFVPKAVALLPTNRPSRLFAQLLDDRSPAGSAASNRPSIRTLTEGLWRQLLTRRFNRQE
jgi:hypothetical protein